MCVCVSVFGGGVGWGVGGGGLVFYEISFILVVPLCRFLFSKLMLTIIIES